MVFTMASGNPVLQETGIKSNSRRNRKENMLRKIIKVSYSHDKFQDSYRTEI